MTGRRAAPSRLGAVRPRRVPGASRTTVLAAAGGGRLGEAAEEIAAGARELAARFSVQIPPSIRVDAGEHVAEISSSVPPAYPNETGSRHPVYARGPDRREWTWVRGNHRPFLGPAAEARAGAAMAKYAEKIGDMARKAGFE